ncbi:MAG: hypothetical protein WBY94_02775, partial [Polyangiaceae bacterium]
MTTRAQHRRAACNHTWAFAAGLCVLLLGRPALAAQAAQPAQAAAPSSAGARALLRIELPKRATYVGEALPVTVRAYFRGDTSVAVTGAPALANTEFTLTESDPVQARAEIGG